MKNAFHTLLKYNSIIYLTWLFFFLDFSFKSLVHTTGTFYPRYFYFLFIFLKGKKNAAISAGTKIDLGCGCNSAGTFA